MARIGLVAGYGRLPAIFAKAAKEKGDTVIAFALKGAPEDGELAKYTEKIHRLEWGGLKKAMLLLVAERIRRIVMLGKVGKDILFKEEAKLDDEAKKMFRLAKDKKDYTVLNEVAKKLKKVGVEVIDPMEYLMELAPSKGVITKRKPTEKETRDIEYGKEVARELSGFDIGQAVAVKDGTVIAVEALEGTDEAIRRAGALTNGGFAVVKVARPNQDMRFDIPSVGLETLKTMIEAKASALALEEKKTLLIDKEEVIALADDNDISIVIV